MSVLILDNRRIFLDHIHRYELGSDALYYRNDTEEERFLFIWLVNDDDLWSKYRFEYLYIKMRDGMSYKIYSDKKLDNLIKKMADFFEENQYINIYLFGGNYHVLLTESPRRLKGKER